MDVTTLSTFFEKHVDKEIDVSKYWSTLSFISANEWHWTEEELMESSIPYVLSLLSERELYIKEMNKKR